MSNNILTIEGVDVSDMTLGIKELVENVSLNEKTRTITRAISSEVTLSLKGFDMIKETFFDVVPSIACTHMLSGSLYVACCDETRNFIITYEGIEKYTPAECTCDVVLEFRDELVDSYRCFRSNVWHREGFIEQANIASIKYCNEFSFMTAIIAILYIGFLPIIDTILFVINLFNINAPGLENFISNFRNSATGCGNYHGSPYLLDIFEFWSTKCGISFSSSILQNAPYDKTAVLCAESRHGIKWTGAGSQPLGLYVEDNFPIMSVVELLDLCKVVFNADYQIINGVLHFERRDFFKQFLVELVDVEATHAAGRSDEPPAYKFVLDSSKAYFTGEYINDSADEKGNESNIYGKYKDIVEWNDPFDDCKEGVHEVEIGFSASSYMRTDQSSKFIDGLRESGGILGESFYNHLLLKNGTSGALKLIIVDSSGEKAIRRSIGDDKFDYNFPYYINENYVEPELYQRFYFIEDPRTNEDNRVELDSYSYAPENFCETVQLIRDNGIQIAIVTPYGSGIAEEIEINYNLQIVTVNKVVI